MIDNVLNGLGRPFFGWISDKIGREETMCIAFLLDAVAIWSLAQYGHDPVMFVVCSAAIYFTWGEIYSLFPATCTDAYGTKYAATNAGTLYTAKGTASLLVPLTAYVAAKGDWTTVFWIGAIANAVVGVLAIVVLKPVRRNFRDQSAPAGARRRRPSSELQVSMGGLDPPIQLPRRVNADGKLDRRIKSGDGGLA